MELRDRLVLNKNHRGTEPRLINITKGASHLFKWHLWTERPEYVVTVTRPLRFFCVETNNENASIVANRVWEIQLKIPWPYSRVGYTYNTGIIMFAVAHYVKKILLVVYRVSSISVVRKGRPISRAWPGVAVNTPKLYIKMYIMIFEAREWLSDILRYSAHRRVWKFRFGVSAYCNDMSARRCLYNIQSSYSNIYKVIQ